MESGQGMELRSWESKEELGRNSDAVDNMSAFSIIRNKLLYVAQNRGDGADY